MSVPTSSHGYGIGLIVVIIGAAIGIGYYQLYYIPEFNAKPILPDKVIHPGDTMQITIVAGSVNQDQQQNFVPKKEDVQLGVNNLVVWTNQDTTAHYVTPDTSYKDAYSGDFGSDAIMPGKTYSFLFTHVVNVPYYCQVHPWMKGEVDIVPGALTS